MTLTMQGRYRFQEFEIDLAHRTLQRAGRTIALDATSFDLLALLVLHPQRVIAEEELTEALWPDQDDSEADLQEHIAQLRKALTGTLPGERLLATISGYGYQFTSPVMEAPVVQAPEIGEISAEGFESDVNLEEDAYEPPDPAHHFADTLERVRHTQDMKRERHAEEDESSERRSGRGLQARPREKSSWQVVILTAVLSLLVFGAWWSWQVLHRPAAEPITLVLADFTNSTGNVQFDLSLKTALALDLEQSPFLTVTSQAAVAQALRQMKADPDKPLFPELTRQLCTQVHGNVYVMGVIRPLGNRYLATVKAYRCSDGNGFAESRGIADSPDAVVAVLDKVAVDLRKQLGESPQSAANFSKPLFADRPASLDALKAYSDASHFEMQGSLEQALTLLQHAVEIDPQFALAFARLGSVYSQHGQRDQAVAALTRAFQLRDSMSEPNRLEVIANYNDSVTGDLQASLRNYKDWSQEYPRNPVPLVALAEREIQTGKMALAIEPAQRALALNPSDALNYAVLARAQLSLGQVAAAANTCQLAISRHFDTEPIHGFLLQIAFLRLDQSGIDAQLAWAREAGRDKSAQPYMQLQQGLMDFAQGKAQAGQNEFTSAAAGFAALGEADRSARILEAMPRIEAELGLIEIAHSQLVKLPAADDVALLESSDIPVAWAHTGETSRSAALLKSELDAHPANTLWQEDFAPQVKAAMAMNQQRFEEAVDDLKPALPFDLRSFDAPAMRGRAYLAAKQPALAEIEFHKILDHPGIEPLSHNYPLAQLGLARALAQEGKVANASHTYLLLLQIWKDADSDLPRLKEAKAEYARLLGEPIKAKPVATAHTAAKPSAPKIPAKRR